MSAHTTHSIADGLRISGRAVILIKETLYRFVFKVGHSLDSSSLKGDAWHHRSDALTSAAAFVGITIALLGGPGFER